MLNRYKDSEEIYMHREVLIHSMEGREMEMITMSSYKGIQTIWEPKFTETGMLNQQRPFKFTKKPVIFLTSRVHPGETPASYVLNGILNFLVGSCQQAKILMDKFVFKIIPMLNPDGVYRGYYRLDIKGQNLNRHYTNPGMKYQPTIFATKAAIVHSK